MLTNIEAALRESEEVVRQAIDAAKQRIRTIDKFRPQVEYSHPCKAYMIGYMRNLNRRPLDGEELEELLRAGIAFPFTGDIRKSFAEFLLHRDVDAATSFLISIFDTQFLSMTLNRQVVLIELMFIIGNSRFRRMKTFIAETQNEQWATALYSLIAIPETQGIADRFQEYIEMFRNG